MRRRKADLARRVNAPLALDFTADQLTSYAGLEIVGQYLQRLDFSRRLRRHPGPLELRGDFPVVSIVRLLLAMLLAGARRLRHVGYLDGDPVVERFCGLKTLPADRTLSRWLSQCTAPVRAALRSLQVELLGLTLGELRLPRLTIDVDGTVLSTGLTVERARRGYNPHHRKVPSYFPITAHLAQTGHVIGLKNRAGNVNDGKTALPFLRDVFADLQEISPGSKLEIRMDGAFFRRDLLVWLDSRAEYAIKAPFYQWLGLKDLVQKRQRWRRVAEDLDGFEVVLPIEAWGIERRVAIYRKKVWHKSPKNYQLDLFDPDDGHYEYSAVVTNKTVGVSALWDFMAGRGAHEKVLSELKGAYAFDAIPTHDYAANSTWQILSVMAHNLMVSFQIEAGATRRRPTAKRSPLFELRRMATMRFEWICRAGLVQRPRGRATLRMARSLPARRTVERLVRALQAA